MLQHLNTFSEFCKPDLHCMKDISTFGFGPGKTPYEILISFTSKNVLEFFWFGISYLAYSGQFTYGYPSVHVELC